MFVSVLAKLDDMARKGGGFGAGAVLSFSDKLIGVDSRRQPGENIYGGFRGRRGIAAFPML